jgi:hypothetical protein
MVVGIKPGISVVALMRLIIFDISLAVIGARIKKVTTKIITLLEFPIAVLFSASLFPCGWAAPFTGPYLHLTAEPSPPGSWAVTHFETTGEESNLSHSHAYQDREVMEFLVDWIEARSAHNLPGD